MIAGDICDVWLFIDSSVCSSFQLPVSHAPSVKFPPPARRASHPLPSRASMAKATLYTNVCTFQSVDSDVSVNAPQIDKIAEFPLASCEDHPFFPVCVPSSTSVHCYSSSARSACCSITKDKCTVHEDKVTVPTSIYDALPGGSCPKGSECSKHVTAGVSIHSSAELHQRRFDTSSYQQRAEALEGLLEFSARLLQHQRFDELGVLLKPFGLEKVSPRETAIWLAKSFKETVI